MDPIVRQEVCTVGRKLDAASATRILKSGTTVTVDGERGAVLYGGAK